ncbi:hypothetical protein BDW02DRAFT_494601 [Decorospora gaudefroyi]|uniref:Uncharacterized protein n=1 Tax=Decorospora gaudefroyi TaxID=184978 RepID=A0A6A5KG00_9PLEO|nr:hypothetical protein BDW02DRAFT_494601 [Decorospora gaudefroyi]
MTPGQAFELIHSRNFPNSPDTPVFEQNLGLYPSFTSAQTAALQELWRTLTGYLLKGYFGRYCGDITLEQRGLITAFADTWVDGYPHRREIWLNELIIRAVDVGDNHTWEAEARLAGEDSIFNTNRVRSMGNMGIVDAIPKPVVRLPARVDRDYPMPTAPTYILKRGEPLPVSSPEPTPAQQTVTPRPRHTEEREVDWAQSRPPWPFRNNNDGLFRRPDDPPYSQRMVLLPRVASEPHAR